MKTFWLALFSLFAAVAVNAQTSPPTITSFSPTTGPVGSQVVIQGTGFVALMSVTFGGGAQAAGSYTSTQLTVTVPAGAQTGPIVVTTQGGSASTATDFTVGAALPVPVATLAATVPIASVSSGQNGEFTVTLSSALTSEYVVNYTLGGTADNGTDYALLKGTTNIKPGKTSKVIKVAAQGNLGGAAKKTVKLALAPGTDYTVGSPSAAKVKITP